MVDLQSEEYLLIRRMFACGTGGGTFDSKYNVLEENKKEILYRAARRMWLTLVIRYHLSDNLENDAYLDRFLLESQELPSLEIYLLFTCLDTLAQKGHKRFPDWLKQQKILEKLTIEEIIQLYKSYEENHGVTKNLRQLFRSLPESTKRWINENVTVQKMSKGIPSKSISELETVIDHVFNYFYKMRRNLYTHESSSIITSFDSSSGFRALSKELDIQNSWTSTNAVIEYEEKHSIAIRFRYGIDEALILRTILYSVGLQYIGFETDIINDLMVSTFVTNQFRQKAIYNGIDEIKQNAWNINWWISLTEEKEKNIPSLFFHTGIPLLKTERTIALEESFTETGWEVGFRKLIREYLGAVEQINTVIHIFNQAHPHPVRNWNEDRKEIREFCFSQSGTDPYKFVVKMPKRVEMTNLALLARDPCYS